jgi:hypothetical protein
MSEQEFEKQQVTIDGVDYYYEDLPKGIQHVLGQIGYARGMKEDTELEVQRYEMMQAGYVVQLKEEMERYLSAND